MGVYAERRLIAIVAKHSRDEEMASYVSGLVLKAIKATQGGLLRRLFLGPPYCSILRNPDGGVQLVAVKTDGTRLTVNLDVWWEHHPVLGWAFMKEGDGPRLQHLFERKECPARLTRMLYVGKTIVEWTHGTFGSVTDNRAAQELQEFASLDKFKDFCILIEGVSGSIQIVYYYGEREDGSREWVITAHDHPEFRHWFRAVGDSPRPGYHPHATVAESGHGKIPLPGLGAPT